MNCISQKLQAVADSHGFVIHNVPSDGNCGINCVIDQLLVQCVKNEYNVHVLQVKTVEHLTKSDIDPSYLVRKEYSSLSDYCNKQKQNGNWCVEIFLKSLSSVVRRPLYILHESGQQANIWPQDVALFPYEMQALCLGLTADLHYVSLHQKPVERSENNCLSSGLRETQPDSVEHHHSEIKGDSITTEKIVEEHSTSCNVQVPAKSDDVKVSEASLPSCVKRTSWQVWCKSRSWLAVKDQKIVRTACMASSRKGLVTDTEVGSRLDHAFVRGTKLEKSC